MIFVAFLPYIVPVAVVLGLIALFELMAGLHIQLFTTEETLEAPVRFEFDPASLEHLQDGPTTATQRAHS